MDNGVDDFFQKSFRKSGASSEIETTNKLSTYFDVQSRPSFIDLDAGKSREGDIVAKEIFPSESKLDSTKHMLAQLILTVE
jgi:hypothetical protein